MLVLRTLVGVAPFLLLLARSGRRTTGAAKGEQHMTRVRAILLVGVALSFSMPASASASGIELRVGGFAPRGSSDLFDDVDELYAVDESDFTGFTGGIEYSVGVGDRLEIGFHLDGYGRTVTSAYRDF